MHVYTHIPAHYCLCGPGPLTLAGKGGETVWGLTLQPRECTVLFLQCISDSGILFTLSREPCDAVLFHSSTHSQANIPIWTSLRNRQRMTPTSLIKTQRRIGNHLD